MKKFLGIEPDGRLYKNPFRKDRKPSCSFYTSNAGVLYFKDWAQDITYDIIDVIRTRYACSYSEALDKARSADIEHVKEFVKLPKIFTFVPTPEYHEYWKKLGVSKELLHEYSVFNVRYVYCDGNILFKGTRYNPIFGYSFPSGHTKFYRPLTVDREKKWSGNADEKDINGYHQLPWYSNLLIVTKSMKDVLVLRSFGFSAIAPQGESNSWDAAIVSQLKKRFSNIIVMYDNDEAGIKYGTAAAKRFGAKSVYFQKAKDISDHVAKHGRKYTIKCLKKYVGRALAS